VSALVGVADGCALCGWGLYRHDEVDEVLICG